MEFVLIGVGGASLLGIAHSVYNMKKVSIIYIYIYIPRLDIRDRRREEAEGGGAKGVQFFRLIRYARPL